MKATVSRKLGGLSVHTKPAGATFDELWPGYQVTVTGEEKKTDTRTWQKIRYLFDGRTYEGWVAKAVKVGKDMVPTLVPDTRPPDWQEDWKIKPEFDPPHPYEPPPKIKVDPPKVKAVRNGWDALLAFIPIGIIAVVGAALAWVAGFFQWLKDLF